MKQRVIMWLRKKLRRSSGETLAETLVAVLIVALASVTLAAMIGSATRLNIRAKKYDKELDEALIAMSTADGEPGTVYLKPEGVDNPFSYSVSMKSSPIGGSKLMSYECVIRDSSEP